MLFSVEPPWLDTEYFGIYFETLYFVTFFGGKSSPLLFCVKYMGIVISVYIQKLVIKQLQRIDTKITEIIVLSVSY